MTDLDGPWAEPAPDLVRAAGGLVLRAATGDGRGPEVLLVHRPRYDDWSFPKGKCDPGESFPDTAVREVEEETGLRCTLDAPLQEVHYIDGRGRPKVVRYWTMTVVDGDGTEFQANDEVDLIAWLTLDEAVQRLTYAHDADVLRALPAS